MSDQKIYVGGAKEINGNFGAFHRISFSKQDLETMMNNLNEKGYINLNMNKRREPSQYGQTHSLTVDTWKPNQQAQPSPQAINQYQQGQHSQFQAPVNTPPEPTEVINGFDNMSAMGEDDNIDEDIPF